MGQTLRALLWFMFVPLPVAYGVPILLAHYPTTPILTSVAIDTAGAFVTIIGTAGLLWCLFEFLHRGHGTPAPYEPPTDLVVSGLYRYTRNPMYASVLLLVIGQALWWGSLIILGYAAVLWAGFQSWVVLYEEPGLRRRFRDQYVAYCASVPRWLGVSRSTAKRHQTKLNND